MNGTLVNSAAPAGRARDVRVSAALAGCVLVGLSLRLWSLTYGLPGIFNMDEKPILDRALTFAKGDPNPHNFLYPTLYLYLLFIWEGLYFAFGRIAGWFASVQAFQTAYFVDPSGHVLAGRLLGALAGTATIPAAYLLGARLYTREVGLAAALFMAVAPLAVRDAHYIKLDVPVTLFATLSLAWLAPAVSGRPRASSRAQWMTAGALAGLAISTHYYAAFLAVPFVAAAAGNVRSLGWRQPVVLLLYAGAATVAAFLLTSPFFALEPSAVIRDFTELRQVDIDRAVGSGAFSSLSTYARLLFVHALGFGVGLASLAGALAALGSDWRRAAAPVGFVLAFLAFVGNTFPASRYLNIVLPAVAVLAAYAVVRAGDLVRKGTAVPVLACVIVAGPGLIESVRWDRFFAADDTRTLAARFIEQHVPAGRTVLVQPYSAPIRRSREGLLEAIRARVGDERRAPLKFQLELAASGNDSPAYRVLFLGANGKTGAVPGDVDKIYLAPRQFTAKTGIAPLQEAGVDIVVLTRYGDLSPALVPLETALRGAGTRLATFSPYREGIDARIALPPPFSHNGNTWLSGELERPGPVVEIWSVTPGIAQGR